MEKRKYRVPDMHCPNCKMVLEGLEDDLSGIQQIYASYHQQTLEIEFDERLVSEARILQAAKDLGYPLAPA
ncbi:copper chaperone [Longilinea arvoryzae]|uniref:Copper chaperone n=1 Tax=Longilinea arvoryzae TaxID=360412 RepID=A0A0S7BB06_9CHLR|nr:heavy-metal-associated domain-containing protein [Longilinea arvoryzae]GAP14791.1 copper chaperone [Longilinea arvoryzae]